MRDIQANMIAGVETLATALDHAIREGDITTAADVQRFMAAWLDGMRSMIPATEPGTDAHDIWVC